MLQGGDCAETFASATADNIRDRVKTILQMAAVLTYGASHAGRQDRPDGRAVRQAALRATTRPATGVTLPAYRGDMVNDFDFTPRVAHARPAAAGQGLPRELATLNLVRAFTQGGFADLRQVHDWNQGFVANPANARYERLAKDIDRAMKFMARLRRRLRRDAHGRVLRRARGAAAGLRAAADPHRLAHRRPRTTPRATSSGSGSAPATSTARTSTSSRGSATRSASSSSAKADPDDVLRLIDKLDPDREPGPAHLHHPHGRGQASARRCRRSSRRSPAPAPRSRGSATPCTATPSSRPRPATRPATSTTSSTRSRGFFEVHRGARHGPRRHPRRAHRQRRHRVPRRLGADQRRRPRQALRVGVRPAAEPPAEPGAGVPRRRDAGERP